MGVDMLGAFIAARAKEPRLKLDEEECKDIASKAENVASYYNVPVSPVMQAWIGLIGCIGATYYAKIAALRLIKSMEAPADGTKQ